MSEEEPELEKYFGVWSDETAEEVREEIKKLRKEFNRYLEKRQKEVARKLEDINLTD